MNGITLFNFTITYNFVIIFLLFNIKCFCSKVRLKRIVTFFNMQKEKKVFTPRETLMSRANSVKKAVLQIMEHTDAGESAVHL